MRRSALIWALAHVPLLLLLYADSIGAVLASLPARYAASMSAAFVVEAAFLSLLPYFVTLPLSRWPRAYPHLVPVACALAAVVFFVDGRLFRAMQMHLNGLVARVVVQPRGLAETGLEQWEILAAAVAAAAWVLSAWWIGSRFVRRFARAARVWPWVLAIAALQPLERAGTAALAFIGGPGLFAAAQTLPLQAPLRMNTFLGRLTGRRPSEDIAAVTRAIAAAEARARSAREPASVHLAATPDIVFVIVESLRADLLDSATMPHLWARARGGARFLRHYASASSTHYALFALLYGLDARRLERTVAAGRKPLLFSALRARGYRMRLLAASSVDWMGLRDNVFGEVQADLVTEFPGAGQRRDSALVVEAERFLEQVGPEPLFLFLFLDGTHFPYTFPAGADPFRPYWSGGGTMAAARAGPLLVTNRARNAARSVDARLEAILSRLERAGRGPFLLVVIGDHGEEYGERGRIGHGNDVVSTQTHVPLILAGPGVAPGVHDGVTSHVDVVPTLFVLLGDTMPPARWSDGLSLFGASPDGFVLTTVGWEPRYAVVGARLKATFFGLDAGLGGARITDPADQPLPDADRHLRASAGAILRALARGRSR